MIRIYQAQDLPQAQLILNMLEQHQISALLQNANAQGAVGEVPFTHAYPEVWIKHDKDKEIAKQLVNQFEQPLNNEQWYCQSCEEFSPMTFELCWACESPREENG